MRKRKYRHLRQADRDRLERFLAKGYSFTAAARVLGFDKSTISREVKRNGLGSKRERHKYYKAILAGRKGSLRRSYAKYRGKKIDENKKLKTYIIKRLKSQCSPVEISESMRAEEQPFNASKTAIYDWIYSDCGSDARKYFDSKHRGAKLKFNVRTARKG